VGKAIESSIGQNIIDPESLIKGYGVLKEYAAELDVVDWTSPVYDQVLAREEQAATHSKSTHSSAA
jgi:hypothetical protein